MKLCVVLFFACLAAFSEDASVKTTVYLYRERAYVGSLRKMPIFMDEIQVGDLVNRRYFSMQVDLGEHVFRCRTKSEAIRVKLEPGKEYYLRAELIQGFTKNHWRVVQMNSEQGKLDVQRLKPLDSKHITPLARKE